jgi:hypothetical protein
LEALCVERGMSPPLARRIAASLSEAELSRFDPTRQSGGALERQLQEGQQLVREIGRFRAKEAA